MTKSSVICLFALLWPSNLFCGEPSSFDEMIGDNRSLIDVIANVEKFQDEQITVKGYFVYKGDFVALFLNKESAEYGIKLNALFCNTFLKNDELNAEYLSSLHGKYVVITGRFSSEKGPHNMFSGAINSISTVNPLKKRIY